VTRNSPRAIDPAVKSGNYLNNVLALGEARRRDGAYEAILCADDGSIAEGSTSNVFAVVKGEIWTPGSEVGILDGITRAKVIELARGAGLKLHERRIQPDELRGAEEAFLTSATRGVLPITTIDGAPVGAGVPGPVTRRLMALYDELARRGVE
jgi:branched-chain amino acid aminotransferase